MANCEKVGRLNIAIQVCHTMLIDLNFSSFRPFVAITREKLSSNGVFIVNLSLYDTFAKNQIISS
jgi:hypothetical protein